MKHKYDWTNETVALNELVGKKFTRVDGLEEESDEVVFTLDDGREIKMYHEQDCCESVYITDVCGDVSDLIDCEIFHFEERTNTGDEESEDKPDEFCESFTWTFYDIQTSRGSVNIRWLGESNGYYSESVEIKWGKPVDKN